MRTETKERPFWRQTLGARVLCSALFVVGLAAFLIATAIDVDYWWNVARSDLAKLEYAGGSIVFRSVSFLFAGVVAYQCRRGTLSGWAMGGFAALVLVSFASIGMSSVLGFGSRERIVPYEQAQANAVAQQDAFVEAKARQLKLENEMIARQRKLQDDNIKFLQKQASNSRRSTTRQLSYDALGQATFGPAPEFKTVVIEAPTIKAASDPQAEAIHKLVPDWSIASIQLWTTAAFGIGLIIAEMVCMGFAVGMWPKAPVPTAESEPKGRKEEPDIETVVGVEAPAKSAEIIHPAQFSHPARASIVEEPVETLAQSELFGDVEEHMSQMESIKAFWEQGTRRARAARIGASAMYRAYQTWCEDRKMIPVTQRKFGLESGVLADDLNLEKDTSSNKAWFYLGRAIVLDQEGGEPELLMAA